MTSRRACAAIALATTIATACAPREHVAPPLHAGDGPAARAIATVVLSRPITMPDNFIMRPDEFAGVLVDHERDVLYVGSREGTLLALDPTSGAVRWEKELGGAVASTPALVTTPDGDPLLLVGTDNGDLFAFDPDTLAERWHYETDGRIRNAPLVIEGVAYVVNSRDQVFALDVRTGTWRWQYEQELQTDFTVYGHAGLAALPSADPAAPEAGSLLACFDNGKAVALSLGAGESLWIASVAPPGGGNFVDCDSTPLVDPALRQVYVSGASTGVHALHIEDGTSVWTFPMRGAGTIVDAPGGALAVASSLEGVFALDRDGRTLWRRQLDPGTVSMPVPIDDTLVLTHSEQGLVALDAATGELLGRLVTGSGMSSLPSWDPIGERLYAITNRGILIGLRLDGRSRRRARGRGRTCTGDRRPGASARGTARRTRSRRPRGAAT